MGVDATTIVVASKFEEVEDFDSNHSGSFECNSLSASIINLCKITKNVLAKVQIVIK